MKNEDAQRLAEQIEKLINQDSADTDISSLRTSIDAIAQRVEKIESALSDFKFQIPPSGHPSRDRFAIADAIVDGIFNKNTTEKACAFEPNGRPCDHCSMCSSLGF